MQRAFPENRIRVIVNNMNLKLVDAHTHVHFSAFSQDYREAVQRALDAGVGMITVGTQRDTSRRAVEVAKEFSGVWAAVGLHPVHTEKSYHDPQELGGDKGFTSRGEGFDYEYYKSLAMDPKVVAIGECGLDYFRIQNDESRIKNQQKDIFIKHLELAKELDKPLMIHCRPSKGTDDAYEDLLPLIHNSSFLIPRILHFYVGSLEITKKFVEAGFYFTFGGVVTFTRDYDEAIKYIPLDRILLETDAPYVAPEPHRGKRNEPSYIIETAKKMAELKNVSVDKISEITMNNSLNVFRIRV